MLLRLSLVWGIHPFYLKSYDHLDEAIPESVKILKDQKLLKTGDCVVYVGSIPLNLRGKTNVMKVSYI